ncbi:MAG: signal peptidase II [Desulfobacteraceae bacterium]|nr:signal peptidase II [Desulfobacteraceae bacterium]
MNNKYTRLILISGIVVLLDQITKIAILDAVPMYQTISVIPGFFNLSHIHNPGGAFGFLSASNSSWLNTGFLVVTLLALGLIFYFYKTTPETHKMLAAGFALICGGAIGNFIDRIRFGEVVDFLDFYIGQWHWPSFNVADSAITIGILVFLYHIVFRKLPE